MNRETISKAINPYIINEKMTWDSFDKIFGFLSKKEQYAIADVIQDNLKISLVEELISPGIG